MSYKSKSVYAQFSGKSRDNYDKIFEKKDNNLKKMAMKNIQENLINKQKSNTIDCVEELNRDWTELT